MSKLRAFKIDEEYYGGYTDKQWFDMSLQYFKDDAPSKRREDYNYVQLIPISSYKAWFSGNDGAQGWRHKVSGWTFPDYCRQEGGCPEVWTRVRKKNLEILEGSPIFDYLVIRTYGEEDE